MIVLWLLCGLPLVLDMVDSSNRGETLQIGVEGITELKCTLRPSCAITGCDEGCCLEGMCCNSCPIIINPPKGTEGPSATPTVNFTTLMSEIPCLPGLGKFASSVGHDYYYECQPGDEHPILKRCLENEFWNRDTMLCKKETNDGEAYKDIVYYEPVLGRPVMLGDLYDSRRKLIMNGYSLWNYTNIEENKLIKNKFYSNTDFFAEQSINDRLEIFDIDATLGLSFLGGLVRIDGSAHYLKDSRASNNIVRYNMMYDATTRFETIPMSMRENIDFKHICNKISKNKKEGPTHVITSIEYGMKAVFVFETKVSIHEDTEKIEGSLQVVVKSIPSFKIDGKAEAKFTEQENNTISSIDVNLFGDFILEDSPTTYKGALEVYQNISHYLGEEKHGYNKASPLTIMLTPVGHICTDAVILLESITADLMTVATKMMADLEKEMVYVNTLQNNFLAQKFVNVSSMIGLFHQNLTIFKIKQGRALKDIIPRILSGDGEEELMNLYTEYTNSPFSYDKAIHFLKERDRELSTINFLFNDQSITDGYIQVGDLTSANINGALLRKTYVIIYWFRVLSNINETKKYLESKKVNANAWYNKFPLVGSAGLEWQQFRDFAIRNKDFLQDQTFFIKLEPYINDDGISQFSVYQNGVELISDFKVPISPSKPKIQSRAGTSVTLNLGNTKNNTNTFVNEIFVNYRYTYQLSGKEMQSNYQNVTVNINDHKDGTGKIFFTIDLPLERSIQIIEDTALTAESESTPIAKPIKTMHVVSVIYTLFSAFQTPFGRGPYSDPLEVGKPVAKGICFCNSIRKCDLKEGNLLTNNSTDKLELFEEFFISFEFKINSFKINSTFNSTNDPLNVIYFTNKNGTTDSKILEVSINKDIGNNNAKSLEVSFNMNDSTENNDTIAVQGIAENTWYKMEICQKLASLTLTRQYTYRIKLQETIIFAKQLPIIGPIKPVIFNDVSIYATKLSSPALDGSIRKLYINPHKCEIPGCAVR